MPRTWEGRVKGLSRNRVGRQIRQGGEGVGRRVQGNELSLRLARPDKQSIVAREEDFGPNSRLKGEANLLIMPTLDAANITFNLIKTLSGDGITVGPILLGAAKPVHILTPTATVRRLVNMAALASVDAAFQRQA